MDATLTGMEVRAAKAGEPSAGRNHITASLLDFIIEEKFFRFCDKLTITALILMVFKLPKSYAPE